MSDIKRERIPVPHEVKRRTIELLDVKRMATLPSGEQVLVKLTAAQAIEQACKESNITMRPNWGRLAGSFVFSWRKSLESFSRREEVNKLRQQQIITAPATVTEAATLLNEADRVINKPAKTKIAATTDSMVDGDLAAKFAAKLEAAKQKGGKGGGKKMPGGCSTEDGDGTGDWSEITSD